MRAQIGADDYTIIVGLVLTYGTFVNAICRKLMEQSGSEFDTPPLMPSLQSCMRGLGDTPNQFQKLALLTYGRSGPCLSPACVFILTENVIQEVFAITFIYATALMTIKFSILLLYRRLFVTPKFKLATNILAILVVLWWIAVLLAQILQCRPIQGIWDSTIQASCVKPSDYYIGVAVPNILTDVAMLCLPVRMVWPLHTKLVPKIALTFTFLTGGL